MKNLVEELKKYKSYGMEYFFTDKRYVNLVSSFPKSGATWFRFLMYVCHHGQIERSMEIGLFYPEIHQKLDYIKQCYRKRESVFVKSHFPYFSDLPLKENIKHSIYIIRNPFDTIVSKLNHYLLYGANKLELEHYRNNFLKTEISNAHKKQYQINDTDVAGGWANHVISWLVEAPKHLRPYVIKYEDLLQDTIGTISKINKDLDLGFTNKNISEAVRLTSFQKMRLMEKNELEDEIPGAFYAPERKINYQRKGLQFVNRGEIGYYKEIMPEEIMVYARKEFEEAMKLTDYI